MCIIIHKPHDVDMISKPLLKRCWDKNDDGAGYSFFDRDKQTWVTQKGFMTWKKFWGAFNLNGFNKSSDFIVHFRIGTAGNTDGGNTHPFPICDDYDVMRKEKFTATQIAYHNGSVGAGDKHASDTMRHIKTYVFPLFNQIEDEIIEKIIIKLCETSHNRWLFTNGGSVYMYGTWEEDEGVFYSNIGYKKVKTYVSKWNNGTNKNWGSNWRDDCGYSNYSGGGSLYGGAQDDDKKDKDLKPEKKKEDKVTCPICGEKQFVFDSPYSIGECTCYTCGAVFDASTDKILFFEPEI